MKQYLSKRENSTFAECEAVIERGMDTFLEVGNALLRIRDDRLYRAEFRTFADYCKARWQMARRTADQLIAAANVAGHLSAIALKPQSESQLRPLTALPPKQQREAWQSAVESSPSCQPTAKEVAESVRKIVPMNDEVSSAEPEDETVESVMERVTRVIRILSLINHSDPQWELGFAKLDRWLSRHRPHQKRKAV